MWGSAPDGISIPKLSLKARAPIPDETVIEGEVVAVDTENPVRIENGVDVTLLNGSLRRRDLRLGTQIGPGRICREALRSQGIRIIWPYGMLARTRTTGL
jgi:hypothetical protein